MCLLFFFFSSRRRHTISLCDWSSDVCSSDLEDRLPEAAAQGHHLARLRILVHEVCFREVAERLVDEHAGQLGIEDHGKIGRASCRERGEIAGGGGTVEEKEAQRRGTEAAEAK